MSIVSRVHDQLRRYGATTKSATTIWFDQHVLGLLRAESEFSGFTISAIVGEVVRQYYDEVDALRKEQAELEVPVVEETAPLGFSSDTVMAISNASDEEDAA